MKPIVTIPAIFMLFICIGFPQGTIAVSELDALGISQSEAKALTDRLRFELHSSGAFQVIERAMMEEILKEQGFQQSGCVSDECIVEVGKLLAVQNMVGGSLSKVGATYSVSIRVISIETGEILGTAQKDFRSEIDYLLTDGMSILVKDLTTSIGAKELRRLTTSRMPLDNFNSINFGIGLSLKSIVNRSIHPGLSFDFGVYKNKNLYSIGIVPYLVADHQLGALYINYRRFLPELSIPLPTMRSVIMITLFGLTKYESLFGNYREKGFTIDPITGEPILEEYDYFTISESALKVGIGLILDVSNTFNIFSDFSFNMFSFPKNNENNYTGPVFNIGIVLLEFPFSKP